MGALLSHIMVIQISNETRNITLKNPRTYFYCGHCSAPPKPELFPGSSGNCHFPGGNTSAVQRTPGGDPGVGLEGSGARGSPELRRSQARMGASQSHSVEIHISNKTRNFTLKNPRTYFECGQCSHSSLPEMSPGSRGICLFSDNSSSSGVAGVLVYEAESFTLAIYFSNPTDDKSSMVLGLELSPGKAHLDRLVETYTRMANGTDTTSDPDMKFNRVVVSKSQGTVQVSHGPIKVTATMSSTTKSVLEVLLEEQGGSVMEAGIESLCLEELWRKLYLKTHCQEK